MKDLIESYKIRLDQLNRGYKELYEGEKDTIKELLSKYERE